MSKILHFISKSKTNLFIVIALFGLFILSILDFIDNQFSFHDILVEFHGLVFDLFIFGILLTIYESMTSKKEMIKRYKEEINDYRFWESEEAMYRIRGLIKRLVELNEKEIDISNCYLENDKSFFSIKNMKRWKFSGANLKNSSFFNCDLEDAHFYITNLENTFFNQANLTNCKFVKAILYNTVFENCIFKETDLSNAYIKEKNWFEILENKGNIGVDSLKIKFEITKEPIIINDVKIYEIISKK
jgi:hypothetical protein